MTIEDRQKKLRVTAHQLETKIAELEAAGSNLQANERMKDGVADEIGALRKRLLEIDRMLYGCG